MGCWGRELRAEGAAARWDLSGFLLGGTRRLPAQQLALPLGHRTPAASWPPRDKEPVHRVHRCWLTGAEDMPSTALKT